MRLVDADALKEAMYQNGGCGICSMYVDDTPTIDATMHQKQGIAAAGKKRLSRRRVDMLPQEKIMEIIYYMIDKAIDGPNNSVSVNFYADNVDVSIYPMGNGKED